MDCIRFEGTGAVRDSSSSSFCQNVVHPSGCLLLQTWIFFLLVRDDVMILYYREAFQRKDGTSSRSSSSCKNSHSWIPTTFEVLQSPLSFLPSLPAIPLRLVHLHSCLIININILLLENVGVGEREGRLFSPIVARRHFYLAHGVLLFFYHFLKTIKSLYKYIYT